MSISHGSNIQYQFMEKIHGNFSISFGTVKHTPKRVEILLEQDSFVLKILLIRIYCPKNKKNEQFFKF